MIKLRLKRFG